MATDGEIRRMRKEALKQQREETKRMKIETHIQRNPCYEEKLLSRQCIIDDNYRHQETGNCWEFFENYRQCNKFWFKVKVARWWKGEQPYLPDVEDRDRVKEDYKHLLKTYKDRDWNFQK